MRKKMLSVVDRATVAMRVGVKLIWLFDDGERADPTRIARLFARLRLLMRGLPPSQYLSPQYESNMASWPRTWEDGQYKAARFQMLLLVRKLRRYRDDWGGGGILAVPFPPSPLPVPAAVGITG